MIAADGVMPGHLLSLDMDGGFRGAFADPPGGFFHAVGDDVPKAFALPHFFQHSDQRAVVSPGYLNTAGVFLSNQAVFIALHGKSHDGAGGNRIDAVAIAEVVGHEYRIEVIIKAVGAEHGDGLILGAVSPLRPFIFAPAALHDSFATHGAAVAGHFFKSKLLDLFPADRPGVREIIHSYTAVVLHRGVAAFHGFPGDVRGAVFREPVGPAELFQIFSPELFQPRFVGDGHLHFAPDGDGFELL